MAQGDEQGGIFLPFEGLKWNPKIGGEFAFQLWGTHGLEKNRASLGNEGLNFLF